MYIRVEEALAVTKRNGHKITKKELAAKIWPDSTTEVAQQVAMTRLCNGKCMMVKPEWLITIARETGVSTDFLLGLKDE